MVDENEEIVKIEEVNKKLFEDITFIKKASLICAKIGLTFIGYYSSFLLGSVVLNEENLNIIQAYGLSFLSILNFISSTLIVKNIKNVRKNNKNKEKYTDFDIYEFFEINKNIFNLSLLYGITGLSMDGIIDICNMEEIKNMLMLSSKIIQGISLGLFFYDNCYFGNIDEYIEKIYKK